MKKIARVVLVDCMGLLISIFGGFVLPKIFSISDYSFLKSFGLYAAYAGVFHFGFSDGMYIMLGGVNQEEIKISEKKRYFRTLILIDFISCAILIVLWKLFYGTSTLFPILIAYIFPFQLVHFMRLYFRAISEFDRYAYLQACFNILNFANMLVVLIKKDVELYLIGQIVIMCLLAIYAIWYFMRGSVIDSNSSQDLNFIDTIKLGIMVMSANTLFALFISLDRWFVKLNYSETIFAYYSFATSMLTIFIVLVTSFSNLAFPYLSRMKHRSNELELHKVILMLTSFAPLGYYVLSAIVRVMIPDYLTSLSILRVLLIAMPFISLNSILFSNMYKATQRTWNYMRVSGVLLIFSLLMNYVVYYLFKEPIYVSYATLITFILWTFIASRDFADINFTSEDIKFISFYLLFNMIMGYSKLSLITEALLYCGVILFIDNLFYKTYISTVTKMVVDEFSKSSKEKVIPS